jgi:hypothetical protein
MLWFTRLTTILRKRILGLARDTSLNAGDSQPQVLK